MNYLTAWIFSFGIGAGSLHTDFNKNPLSNPGICSEIALVSSFRGQYIGLKICHQRNIVQFADWAMQNQSSLEESFLVEKIGTSFFTGGEVFSPFSKSTISVFAGLSFMDKVGFGLNGSILWKIPNRKKNHRYFYYCQMEFNYWGSDLLDGYKDNSNQYGDIDLKLIFGIQIPIYISNHKH